MASKLTNVFRGLQLLATGAIIGGVVIAIGLNKYLEMNPDELKVGDLVQWLSLGREMFNEPKHIERIESKDGVKYAFFDVSLTGVPLDQLVKCP